MFQVSGFRLRVPGCGLQDSGSGFRIPDPGFRVSRCAFYAVTSLSSGRLTVAHARLRFEQRLNIHFCGQNVSHRDIERLLLEGHQTFCPQQCIFSRFTKLSLACGTMKVGTSLSPARALHCTTPPNPKTRRGRNRRHRHRRIDDRAERNPENPNFLSTSFTIQMRRASNIEAFVL